MHALPQCFQSFYRLSQQLFLQTLLSAVLTFQILEGSADLSQKKNGRKNYLAESEVRRMSKEQLRAMIAWLEIVQETNERLTEVRRELDKLAVSEQDGEF